MKYLLLFLAACCVVIPGCGTRATEETGGEARRAPTTAVERVLAERPAALVPFRGNLAGLPDAVAALYAWVLSRGYFHGGPPFLVLERVPDSLAAAELSGTLFFPFLKERGDSSGITVASVAEAATEGMTPAGTVLSIAWEGPLGDIDNALRQLRRVAGDENVELSGRFFLVFTDTLQGEETRTVRLMTDFRRRTQ